MNTGKYFFLWIRVAIVGAFFWAPTVAAENLYSGRHVYLSNEYPADRPQYLDLIKYLLTNLRVLDPEREDFKYDQHLNLGIVDLNNDGIDEAIIHSYSSYTCGNQILCRASIYSLKKGQWWYAGEIDVREAGPHPIGASIFVEENYYRGWRTLSDGEKRHCWDPMRNEEYDYKDVFMMPRPYRTPGYYDIANLDKPCGSPYK